MPGKLKKNYKKKCKYRLKQEKKVPMPMKAIFIENQMPMPMINFEFYIKKSSDADDAKLKKFRCR